jgi:class 3 adenylate cyclase/TolB-like protein/Flp pilus assembly protein TadD
MTETRKLAAILVADVVGYSRLAGADEDRILARLRGLRSDLFDPAMAAHHGRIVKRTGDGSIIEFRSVVDAVRCAVEVQNGLIERNAGLPLEKRIEFRVGIHVGDVVEENDGDLMGDGVNIAARLEGVAKPGTICLSEDAYRQVKQRLDLKVTDLGATPLKNIAQPVRVYLLEVGQPADKPRARASKPRWGFPAPAAGVAALLLLAAAGWTMLGGRLTKPLQPGDLSIVVLPFANLSNDSGQDYFADGITQNLTNDLSHIYGLFIISRNTAFAYKGKTIDARQIGKELDIRYVLEGSVQRDQQRVRVTAQLTDAATGGQVWGDTFEKPMADLFDLQDVIVAQLANTLRAKLVADIAGRAERNPNPDSTDLSLQGLAWFNKGLTPENLAKAREYYRRALDVDPGNLTVLEDMASVDATIAGSYAAVDRTAKLASAEAALTKVLSARPDDAWAHAVLGGVEVNTNRGAEGIAELERALALNPNLASAQAGLGFAKLVNGRAEETEAHVKEALRLSPRDPLAFQWVGYTAAAKLFSGADEEAVALYRQSIELYRSYPISHLYLAAALQLLGRSDEARKEAETALQLNPKFTIRLFRAGAQSDNPVFLKQRERIIDALRAAGIPEG